MVVKPSELAPLTTLMVGKLFDEGCRVAVVARRVELLEDLAGTIVAAGSHRPMVVQQDLLAPGAAGLVWEAVQSRWGGVDILVNNAGGSRPASWDATEEEWAAGTTLNFEVARQLAVRCLPAMRAQQWGRIINITGINEPARVNIATVAKAALHSWSKGLSREVAKDGITVNCVPPGRINTEQILQRVHPDARGRQELIEQNVPIGYFGEAADIAHVVAFLASPLARYITGEVIHVDGGMHRAAG